ncbi:NAD-dependent epimerase/dehydratase family protein [Alkalicoccobacillus plakortidis]|uniref:NAD(P)-dependent oxidoreductase n=1 Tax=Alkalicoccobacillus plakortidis TaxID=444060 RepID=A0ABT0XGS8_9BACI|nr:NAD(P)-dependent oxidoreductase [Alkalicoccobacillus plakortidis]MCM2675094.1 NAD(P)-dependent oxidoreductase [Alkalicoccobacillus plakortidis]
MEKAVVTGGLGFIGYHLCQALLEAGLEVVCIEQPNETSIQGMDEKLLAMGRNALFEHISGDLDKEDSTIADRLSRADVVFHMASPSSKDSKWPMKHQTILQATKWVQFLCGSMKDDARILFPSTVEVYGDVPGLITEDTPLQPVSSYGMIKAEIELCVQKEAQLNNLNYTILRLPTVYGPWQRPDMTFAQILSEEAEVYQDRSTLDALFVDDVVNGFVLAAKSTNQSDIFHLTSGEQGQWFVAAQKLGAKADILKRTHSRSSLSPKKAEQQLGFNVTVTIEEGLRRQKEHMDKWNNTWDI